MVTELQNFCLLQKWPPQPEHCGTDLVCIMGIKRVESNAAEEDNGVLTYGRLSSNPHCPWAVMKANSILGCTDKGKCTSRVEDCSGALQPNNCSQAFLKKLDCLEFLLQQEGFVWLLKALETTCRQPALQLNTSGQCQHKALKWRFPKMKFYTHITSQSSKWGSTLLKEKAVSFFKGGILLSYWLRTTVHQPNMMPPTVTTGRSYYQASIHLSQSCCTKYEWKLFLAGLAYIYRPAVHDWLYHLLSTSISSCGSKFQKFLYLL